jgi:hypothetical protein
MIEKFMPAYAITVGTAATNRIMAFEYTGR